MQDLGSLYNQALSAVGAAADVTDPQRPGRGADLCNLWFDVARSAVMTAHAWPSLRKTARLARLSTRGGQQDWQNTMPAPGYSYAFALPQDCLAPRHLLDFSRFALERFGKNLAIHANVENPLLSYTCDCTSPDIWSVDLYRAVVFSLAAHINMAKSGKSALTRELEGRVMSIVEDAAVIAANMDDEYFESIPAHYASAGLSVPHQGPRYFYPTTTFRVGGIS